MTVGVDLCDTSFVRLWELETGQFEGVTRLREPGQWRIDMHLDEVPPDVLMSVGAVLVRDGNRVLYAGYRAGQDGGAGGTLREIDEQGRRCSIEGVDCWEWFATRVVFPNPATDEPWNVAADVRSGLGGAVAKAFIEANCGVSALTDRQIPGLVVQAEAAIGTNGEWSGRLQPLSELVARISTESGVVVEPTLTANTLAPIVYLRAAADRRNEIVVADIADLAYAEQRDVPARSTWVLAAGSGEGSSRMFRSAGGGVGLGRKERVVEYSNATTSNELYQFAEGTRREDSFAFYVSGRTNVAAAEQYEYLTDYRLGDIVSVQVNGIRFPVPIAAVTITVSPDQVVETPTLGTYTPDRLRGLRVDVNSLGQRFADNIA